MKNKGFTLIELLAVIVVLAIIALIAFPMILGVVEKARKGAAKSSALGYIDAVEKQIMVNQLNENPEINDGEYSLPMDNTYKISVKGSKPSSGTLTITKSKVVSASMCINNYTVTYDGKTATVGNKCNGTEAIVETGPTKVDAEAGETHKGIVYLDPTNLTKTCNETLASQNVNSNGTPTEIKTGCMKWYIFDDSGDNYTMILDHHTTAHVRWSESDANITYEESNVKPVVDDLVTTSGWEVTPRLMTAEEAYNITEGPSTWSANDFNTFYSFGSKNQTIYSNMTDEEKQIQQKYYWLIDNMYDVTIYGGKTVDNNTYQCNNDCNGFGNYLYSYWVTGGTYSFAAWNVLRTGMLQGREFDKEFVGIRPVITINKATIN